MNDNKPSPRRFLPAWLHGPWGALTIFFTLYILVFLLWTQFHWGGEENVTLIGDLWCIPLDLFAAGMALRVFAQKNLEPRIRRMWLLLGLGLSSYLIADMIWGYLENVLEVPPFPSFADLFYLLFAPFALAGLLALPSFPLKRRERWEFILDLVALMTAAGMLIWYFIIQPTAEYNAGDLVSQAISVAYPVTDLVLVAGIISALLRPADRDTRSTLWLLMLGIMFFLASDITYAYTGLAGTYETGSLLDGGWNLAQLFFIFAALRHMYRAPDSVDSPWTSRLALVVRSLLNLTVIFAFLLTLYVGITDFSNPNYFWLLAGAGFLMFLVVARQVISSRFANYSLRTKLVTAFLFVTLVPMTIIFFINDNATRQNLTDDANQALTAAGAAAAEDIDGFLNQGLNNVRIASQLNIMQEYLAMSPAERAGSEAELAVLSDLRAIASLDQTYVDAVGLMDRYGNDVADTATNEIGSNKSSHRYVSEPMLTNLPYTTVQFSPTTGRFSLYFSAPVHDANGRTIGVLRVRYNAAVLQQIIVQTLAEQGLEGGDILLLDENRIRLADTDTPELILTSIAPLSPEKVTQLQTEGRLPPDKSAEQLSTNLTVFEQGLINASDQPIFAAEIHPGGHETEQVAVRSIDNQPWQVVIGQTQDFYLAPIVEQTRTAGLTVLVIAVLVALAAVAMGRTISNPIVQLRNVANQIAGGDLQAQAPVRSADETGQLAAAFNEMTSQILQRTRAVETSVEVSRRISSILDLNQLVKEVVDQLQSAFNYYHAHIYLLDEKGENLVMAGGTGEAGKTLLERGHKLPANRGLVGRAATTKEAVLVPDTTQDSNWLPNPLLPETKSEIAVPILAGDQVLGVLDVQNNAANSLGQLDADLVRSIANQTSIAIQNIYQYEETRRAEQAVTKRANELELASRVATAAATIVDSEKLLQEVVNITKETFHLYHAHIYLLNQAGDTLDLAAGAGETGMKMVAEGRRIPLSQEQSLVARAARERRGFFVNNVRSDPDFLPHPLLPDTHSELAVPMIVGSEVIGVFDVQSDAIDHFTEEDIRIQTTLSAQVSIALQNARSFVNAKRQAERETALNLIGQKIQSATTVEAVLQIAAREVGRALGAPFTVAQLGMKSNGRNGNDHR